MGPDPNPLPARVPTWRAWPSAALWTLGWGALVAMDGRLDLANMAMLLVLVSALASIWLPGWASALASLAAVAAFNWSFVPPRHTFDVDLQQHALLLAAMVAVNWIISALVIGQRRAAVSARAMAAREARLRHWGDTLRDAADPIAHAGALREALQQVAGVEVALVLRPHAPAVAGEAPALLHVGEPDAERAAGLALCMGRGEALGPGSGHHEEQPDWYLPMRGKGATFGAAVLASPGALARDDAALRDHAQALCDQMGQALQRWQAARGEQAARAAAQEQGVRNALLAAISHDYRTPLASIMGAASSLQEQADRMNPEQRRQVAAGIVEEAARLARLTDNTLQLARLDAPGVQLRCDWESAEELVGAVVRRLRGRDPQRRVRARLEPGLPLLWCDALLMSQLLENLVDNALKYSPPPAPVEILVRAVAQGVVLAVRDRGPGIAPSGRDRIFQVFQRGAEPMAGAAAPPPQRGAGVGLAVCRAIARAHGGELALRPRHHGGSSFECTLPRREPPPHPQSPDPQPAAPT